MSLTDDETNLSYQGDSSSSENERIYMVFVSIVKSELDKVEEDVHNENFQEDTEDEIDIYEAYQLLFKESLKTKKINNSMFKKVDKLERELTSDF